MKVKLKRNIYDWKAGVWYPAEPVFWQNENRVKVMHPGWIIYVLVKWDDIETAE